MAPEIGGKAATSRTGHALIELRQYVIKSAELRLVQLTVVAATDLCPFRELRPADAVYEPTWPEGPELCHSRRL